MRRLFIIFCCASLISCQNKVICPAFQSTYILDDSTRNAYFSYIWQLDENTRSQFLLDLQAVAQSEEDTIVDIATQLEEDTIDTTVGVVAQPKTDYYAYAGEKVVPWRIQKRTKYGIIKKTPYLIKKYQLRTAPMENVLAPELISNDFVASDFTDSLSVDSLYTDSLASQPIVITEKETKYLFDYDPTDNFNVEQEYYNKYFADKFIDKQPKPQSAPLDTLRTQDQQDSLQVKEPFFKSLFKKKKKREELPDDETEKEGTTQQGITKENEEDDDGDGN